MKLFELIVELIVGLAWPILILFIFIYYRSEISHIFKELGKRISQASSLELPGGVKATFLERKIQDTKEITSSIIGELGENVSKKDAERISEKIENEFLSSEYQDYVLETILSYGILSHERMIQMLTNQGVRETHAFTVISNLEKSGFILQDNGRLQVTSGGVIFLQKRKVSARANKAIE